MSVVGFDIGNENCAIAVAKQGGIDVLLNDESKRETPAVVSFGEKQRFLGSAGAAFAITNPKSTISQIKRLIGRRYKDPTVQEELKLLPFETSQGPNGGVLIHFQYLSMRCTLMPVEILGMLFAHLKQMTETNLECPVADCVIGIPSYFTDLQRREYLDAAFLAGLRPLKLIHDCTAIALGYGMYKTDFSNEGPNNVIFVDIGHSDTQVTVAVFEQGKMTILSHAFDQHLGGRDFDEVLFRHFAAQFKEKYNIDVYSNARTSIRLRASCEKLKKVLSANAEAPLSIECLVEDQDVDGFITREEFESLSMHLLERVTVSCHKALHDSGLSVDKIHTIELVGSGSRIPAITRNLTLFFDKEPTRTLNGSECVARGCALFCAMLSPTQQVRDYQVQDLFPHSIGLYMEDGKNIRREEIFLKGSPFPCQMTAPYHGKTAFSCQVFYTNNMDFLDGKFPKVGHFMIGSSQKFGFEEYLSMVKVHLNIHGIVEIDSASILEDKYPSSNNSRLYSVVVRSTSPTQNDAADHKFAGFHTMETRRGRTRKLNLPVSENLEVLTTRDDLHKALKRGHMMAQQDIRVEQTKEKRNTLESFIYNSRSKLLSLYRSMATDSEVEIISKSLQETEEWLYEEGDDESKQVYIEKHQHLKKLFDPVENRYKDENARIEATKALLTCIKENLLAANSFPPSQKKEVEDECIQAERWLNHFSELHDSWANNASRMYCLSAITGISQVFKRRCEDLMRSVPMDSDGKQNHDANNQHKSF